MTEIGTMVARLIEAGTPPTLAAEIVATAFVAGAASITPRRSSAAERQARYRERNKASHVTDGDSEDRNESDDSDGSPSPSSPPSSSPPIPPLITTSTPTSTPESAPEARARPTGRKRREPRPLVPLPDDLMLDEGMADFAKQRGFSPDRTKSMFDRFCDNACAKGLKYADWRAAWRTWVNNQVDFDKQRQLQLVHTQRRRIPDI